MNILKCGWCGKNRNQGNHRKCSKELQKMYAPGTALYKEQLAIRQGMLAEREAINDLHHLGNMKHIGFKSKSNKYEQ